MTDKELLEAAAKAADVVGIDGVFPIGTPDGQWRPWNPLQNDEDAFRLAVRLRLNISHADPAAVKAGWSAIQAVPFTLDGMGPWHWKEWLRDHQDVAAATRMAIVNAAAAIATEHA